MVATRSLVRQESARKIASSELMSGVLPAYALLFVLAVGPYVCPVPAPVQLIPTTLVILFIGCHIALRNKHRPGEEDGDTLQAKDAYMFPVFGSIALLSLYCAYKFLPKEYLDMIISAYFFVIGVFALSSTVKTFVSTTLSMESFKSYDSPIVQFRIPGLIARFVCDMEKPDGDLVQISKLDVPCAILGSACSFIYLKSRHALANNFFGYAFSIQAISLLSLDSFWTGAVLLLGLFFYDIFFVFGTDVMVTVATKFDAPIKLLFPRAVGKPTMLGLGDIVIPGLFVSLMLRLDHKLHCDSKSPRFTKPYFTSVCLGYLAGIVFTLYIMYAFNHAQPALLYLVPGCLLSVILCAAVRGELGMLMAFKDEHIVEDKAHAQ